MEASDDSKKMGNGPEEQPDSKMTENLSEQADCISELKVSSSGPQESAPLVLRVKRRVSDGPQPAMAMHSKRLRIQQSQQTTPGTVFRLAGTLSSTSDEAELSNLLSRAISREGPPESDSTERGPSPAAASSQRRPRRRRYRVVEHADSSVSEPRIRMKRKLVTLSNEGDNIPAGPTSNKCVCVFDVEPEQSAPCESDDMYAPTLEEYRRQLEGITVNGELMTSSYLNSDTSGEADYVYDLYVANGGPSMTPGELLLTDDDQWSLTLEDYEEQYDSLGAHSPRWQRIQARAMMEDDLESNPDSESNWRNDYPESGPPLEAYDEEEFDLWMAGREPERLARDSDDDELCMYAHDQDLDGMARGVEIHECSSSSDDENDLEKARDRRYQRKDAPPQLSVRQMRQMMADMALRP